MQENQKQDDNCGREYNNERNDQGKESNQDISAIDQKEGNLAHDEVGNDLKEGYKNAEKNKPH